jgi:hypothetical protein
MTVYVDVRSELLGKELRQLSLKKVQRGGMWLVLVRALISRPIHFLAGGFIMVSWRIVHLTKYPPKTHGCIDDG